MVHRCCIFALYISEEILFVVNALKIAVNKHFIFQVIMNYVK